MSSTTPVTVKNVVAIAGVVLLVLLVGVAIGMVIAYHKSTKARKQLKKMWKKVKKAFEAKQKKKNVEHSKKNKSGHQGVTYELTGLPIDASDSDSDDEELSEDDLASLMALLSSMKGGSEDI